MHEDVRTYQDRIATVQDVINQPLIQLQGVGSRESAVGNPEQGVAATPTPHSPLPTPLHRYRATFEKGEEVKYLSHLDLTRALPRAFRRARVRLGYSQGFHPMPLVQYGPALGVGTVGENELLDFDALDELDERDFLTRINANLPPGLRFKRLRRLPQSARSLIKEINRAEYGITLRSPELQTAIERLRTARGEIAALTANQIHCLLVDEFVQRDSCVIERVRKDKRQKVDVRHYTKGLRVEAATGSLNLVTEISPQGGVKPVEVMAAVYGLTDEEKVSLGSRVRRVRLYSDDEADGQTPLTREVAAIPASMS